MILGLFFLRQKKSKYSVPFKSWGRGVSGSLVYIVYLMSGGTSLATQVGGTTLILLHFDSLVSYCGRDFSGLPLDQKIKKSTIPRGPSWGSHFLQGGEGPPGGKKPLSLPCGYFSQLEKRHWQMDHQEEKLSPTSNTSERAPDDT